MKRAFSIAVIFMVALPFSAYAAIIVNEIAWMGTVSSANDEWIELANTGSETVDMTGWLLAAVDGTPEIALEGVIAPGGFFLLERTNDDTVAGITASQIYTGALSNSGEALTLKSGDGVVVDSVDALGGWQAGDNATKETMQRSGSGWITAKATPGAANTFTIPPSEPVSEPQLPPPAPNPAPQSPAEDPPSAPSSAPQSVPPSQSNQAPSVTSASTNPPAPIVSPVPVQSTSTIQKTNATQNSIQIATSPVSPTPIVSKNTAVSNQKAALSRQENVSTSSAQANIGATTPNDVMSLYGWLFGSVGMGLAAGMGVLYARRRSAGPLS